MTMAAPDTAPLPAPPSPDDRPSDGADSAEPTGLRWGLLAAAALLFALNLVGLNRQGTQLSDVVGRVMPALMARPPSHRLPVFDHSASANDLARRPLTIPAPPPPAIPPPPKMQSPRRPSSAVATFPAALRPGAPAIPLPPRPTLPKGALQTGPVLHLRDMVPGIAWLAAAAPPLRLSGVQRQRLQALLPRIRKNFEGPHGAFDEALEKQVARLLTSPQSRAMRDWLVGQSARPDCIEGLRSLERICGAKPEDDKRATPAH